MRESVLLRVPLRARNDRYGSASIFCFSKTIGRLYIQNRAPAGSDPGFSSGCRYRAQLSVSAAFLSSDKKNVWDRKGSILFFYALGVSDAPRHADVLLSTSVLSKGIGGL